MFVRSKKNRSGKTSVQVIDKASGKYRVLKTIGCTSDPSLIDQFIQEAKAWIQQKRGLLTFDFILGDDDFYFNSVYDNIEQIQLLGPELILGKIYDEIGFHKVTDELFRHLVLSRIVYPVSKLKTVDYLQRYKGIMVDVNRIYRYLDKLDEDKIKQIQSISYDHTIGVLGEQLSVVFYDVTTLYFESERGDELRKTGFSKDGKHQHPQIVLGLLVSKNGYPLDYELFEGNKFEGHTMLPVIEGFKEKYNLEQLIIVADAGLMSNDNLEQLRQKGYSYIIGAKIKTESNAIKEKILHLAKIMDDGGCQQLTRPNGDRLIVGFSEARRINDLANRTKGKERLKKLLRSGFLTKDHINNKGYNRYLVLKTTEKVTVAFDEEKFEADSVWDGLKGYITNTQFTKEAVITYYNELWHIEKTFRIAKSDLQIRPIYHFKPERIKAHICIAFAACKLYKELERQLKEKKANISVEKAIDILKTIYGITLTLPNSKQKKLMLLDKTNEQKEILTLFQ